MTDIPKDQITRGNMFRDLLKEKVLNLVDEYADEAEHQEGESYWDQFNRLDQAYQDLIQYAQGTIDQDQKDHS